MVIRLFSTEMHYYSVRVSSLRRGRTLTPTEICYFLDIITITTLHLLIIILKNAEHRMNAGFRSYILDFCFLFEGKLKSVQFFVDHIAINLEFKRYILHNIKVDIIYASFKIETSPFIIRLIIKLIL